MFYILVELFLKYLQEMPFLYFSIKYKKTQELFSSFWVRINVYP